MITKLKKAIAFAIHCKESYKLWAKLVSREKLVLRLFKDILSEAQADWIGLFIAYGYHFDIQVLEKPVDQVTKQHGLILSLKRRLTLPMPSLGPAEDGQIIIKAISQGSGSGYSNSTDVESNQVNLPNRGFKPRLFMNTGFEEQTFDLEVIFF